LKYLLLIPLIFSCLHATENETSITQHDKSLAFKAQESFLSSVEYGRMLYENPRGISCKQCHGQTGKGGQKIAKYFDKKRNPKILRGVDISSFSLEDLKASLKNEYRENNRIKRHKIMPMYYLTDDEVQGIYDFLQHVNKKK
jgi:mono/diheme cytochrome c family protein